MEGVKSVYFLSTSEAGYRMAHAFAATAPRSIPEAIDRQGCRCRHRHETGVTRLTERHRRHPGATVKANRESDPVTRTSRSVLTFGAHENFKEASAICASDECASNGHLNSYIVFSFRPRHRLYIEPSLHGGDNVNFL